MEQHSMWANLLTFLANMLSKFVKEERLVLRDSSESGFVKVTVSAPFRIVEATSDKDGNITIHVASNEGGQNA